MFAKLALPFLAVSALATSVFSSPLPSNHFGETEIVTVSRPIRNRHTSFNRWRGISSLDNFDDFFGDDDFDGFRRRNQVIVRDHDLVCHSRRVAIIQQRLAVLQEMTKRIITEQICDVETQTIVFEQHHSSLGRFQNDLRRHSGFRVGFDRNIESHFRDFFDSDGSFTTHDFGFRGRDIGRETIVIKDNWDDERSPQSVESAFYESRNAYYFNHFNI